MSKTRVLVADGETLYREGICAMLGAQQDIKVAGRARTTTELIAKAQKCHPDVILVETALETGDSPQTVRSLKNGNVDVKVLLVSHHEDDGHILAGLMSGCDGYILKKAAASDLVSAIRAVQKGGFYLYPSVARVVINDCVQRFREMRETA